MTTLAPRGVFVLVLAVVVFAIAAVSSESVRDFTSYIWARLRGGYSVEERVAVFSPAVESRLRVRFEEVGVPYPPGELAYISFKDTRHLEVYGRTGPDEPWQFVVEYPVLGASGVLGSKLEQGDNQVPEGVYRADFLNPNSRFHLSIRLDYPNDFDKQMAKSDGRCSLGGDIMIHGGSSSVGCLAVGNQTAENLFVLAALATKERVLIIISPIDFRLPFARSPVEARPWVRTLYASLRAELQEFHKRP